MYRKTDEQSWMTGDATGTRALRFGSTLLGRFLSSALIVACVTVPVSGQESDDTKQKPPAKKPAATKPTTPSKVDTPPPSDAKQSPLAAAAAAAAKRRKRTPGKSFTNEDLQRMYGASTLPPASSGAPGATTETASAPEGAAPSGQTPVDAKAWLAQRQLDEQERQKLITAAEAEVKSLEERLQVLERRALTTTNPFLERPKIDPDKEPENKDWDKIGTKERSERTQKELADVRTKLDNARRKLADARRQ